MAKFKPALTEFRTTSGELDVSITNAIGMAGFSLGSFDHLFRISINDQPFMLANNIKIGFYDETARELLQALFDFARSEGYQKKPERR
jgi:hypothetical protein